VIRLVRLAPQVLPQTRGPPGSRHYSALVIEVSDALPIPPAHFDAGDTIGSMKGLFRHLNRRTAVVDTSVRPPRCFRLDGVRIQVGGDFLGDVGIPNAPDDSHHTAAGRACLDKVN
jgi:hypothetical protein